MMRNLLLAILMLSFLSSSAQDQSVAREWNEVMLDAIRDDWRRPAVVSRTMWHTSLALYDAWAVYEPGFEPYFLGNTHGEFEVPFEPFLFTGDVQAAQEEAMSYAAYRLLMHRYEESPGVGISQFRFGLLMDNLGYDTDIEGMDYLIDGPAALGNYLADQIIQFGLQDSSHQLSGDHGYGNTFYEPVNDSLDVSALIGEQIEYIPYLNNTMVDPNRFQYLQRWEFIDSSGEDAQEHEFGTMEWAWVHAFCLDESSISWYEREEIDIPVYYDIMGQPLIDTTLVTELEDAYKWGHMIGASWTAAFDTSANVLINASPVALGNVPLAEIPVVHEEVMNYYDFENPGAPQNGHATNPSTGSPYNDQWIELADYGRTISEWWTWGEDVETIPGYWLVIMNEMSDHPEFERQWMGSGPALDSLEWDVRSFFTLASTLHDCAIATFSHKLWYDAPRPISSFHFMHTRGQSSDPTLANFHPAGLPLIPGFTDIISPADTLESFDGQDLGKVKINTWRGFEFITNPFIEVAGSGWVLAENWLPYQRLTFVSPPSAEYCSGHAASSVAAAECLKYITGDPFFPGGMHSKFIEEGAFLRLEDGPSQSFELQWATYMDAAMQCAESRIWSGTNTPFSVNIGMHLGLETATGALNCVEEVFELTPPPLVSLSVVSDDLITDATVSQDFALQANFDQEMDTSVLPELTFTGADPFSTLTLSNAEWLNAQEALWTYSVEDNDTVITGIGIEINGAYSTAFELQVVYTQEDAFQIETENPEVVTLISSADWLDQFDIGPNAIQFTASFSEAMHPDATPVLDFPEEDLSASLSLNEGSSQWLDAQTYTWSFDMLESYSSTQDIDVSITWATDTVGNPLAVFLVEDLIDLQVSFGIEESGLGAKMYPNPVRQGQHVTVTPGHSFYRVEVFDVLGKRVYAHTPVFIDPGHSGIPTYQQPDFRIPTNGLVPGRYSVVFTGISHQTSHRLQVTR